MRQIAFGHQSIHTYQNSESLGVVAADAFYLKSQKTVVLYFPICVLKSNLDLWGLSTVC